MIFDEEESSPDDASLSDILHDSPQQPLDRHAANIMIHSDPGSGIMEYIPSMVKLTDVLSDFGFVVKLSITDIDEKSRSISAFVIEAWAESALVTMKEIISLMQSRERAVKDASLSSNRGYANTDALQSRVSELQNKLYDAERKLSTSEAQKIVIEEERDQNVKKIKGLEADMKRSLKNFDQQMQECERRVRQREAELERLKAKLQSLAVKDRSTEEKHKQTLHSLRQGDISFESKSSISSRSSSHSSPSSADHRSSSKSLTGLASNSSKANMKAAPNSTGRNQSFSSTRSIKSAQKPSLEEVVEALEAEQCNLRSSIEEKDIIIHRLTETIKVFESQNQAGSSSSAPSRNRRTNIELSTAEVDDLNDDTFADSGTGREMLDKLTAQKRRIEQLEHRCESYKRAEESNEDVIRQMRIRTNEMRDEIENLRLELDNRPTMRQWSMKQTELQDLEDKLHDLVMMRGEAAEIAAWRQHLSTRDRIKVDKRNYELGLWLLDSLPKAVAKEILQGVCRELDVSDVSEIIPCIVKLKAVVKTVPRMDRFISQVCAFLFQRDKTVLASLSSNSNDGGGYQPTMEDALPALKRWWVSVQRCEQLEAFTNKIFCELRRRERLLISARNIESYLQEEGTSDPSDDLLGRFDGRMLWAQRDMDKGIELIRDMCDFQIEVMKSKKSFQSAEEFIHDHPEEMTSRILSHLQYLFQVSTLEGLLPRLNQVYIFTEEMKNFLSIMREVLGLPAGTTDTILLAEIQNHTTRTPKF